MGSKRDFPLKYQRFQYFHLTILVIAILKLLESFKRTPLQLIKILSIPTYFQFAD